MEMKQFALGFGVLVILAAFAVLLADGPREATQQVLYANGLVLLVLSSAVGARETCDADGPGRTSDVRHGGRVRRGRVAVDVTPA